MLGTRPESLDLGGLLGNLRCIPLVLTLLEFADAAALGDDRLGIDAVHPVRRGAPGEEIAPGSGDRRPAEPGRNLECGGGAQSQDLAGRGSGQVEATIKALAHDVRGAAGLFGDAERVADLVADVLDLGGRREIGYAGGHHDA
jgi:hypothetical protein